MVRTLLSFIFRSQAPAWECIYRGSASETMKRRGIGTEAVTLLVERACFPEQSSGVCIPTQSMGTSALLRSLLVSVLLSLASVSFADQSDFYRIVTLPTPEGLAFEVGGMDVLPDGRVVAAIRKGEVWVVDGAYDEPPKDIAFKRIANALHEPLGLMVDGDDLLTTQRAEVTRLRDLDGDDVIDAYLTVSDGWGITGNYHEYAYGPKRDGQGRLWVTLNQTIGPAVVKQDAPWRGWGVVVDEATGDVIPMNAGMRSPCGLGANVAGDMFYTDQQGNWVPAGSLHHLRKGVYYGHADSLKDMNRPGSPLKHPGTVPAKLLLPDAVKALPDFRLPAVWFPYRKMGMSATDIQCDQTGGKFGPFAGQLFVGDFTMAQVNRVFLEKVDGEYQGACFPFVSGLQSAVVRMAWGKDGSMFVGETNRGWNSTGNTSYGFERLVWTGKTPFEILSMEAQPDGFTVRFTKAVDDATALDLDSYVLSSYTYFLHQDYGCEEQETKTLAVESVTLGADKKSVRLVVPGLREGYVHELHAPGVKAENGETLWHGKAYYTLNKIPKE